MPGHPDHQGSIMPEVRGPPILRCSQHPNDILFDRRQVEFFEFFRIVKSFVHWVRQRRMKPKNPEVQLVWPPISVARPSASDLFQLTPDKGAFARCTGMVHGS